MTDSGYPRQVRRWKRGQPLAEAALVYEGRASDVYVYASVDRTPGFERTVFARVIDFYNSEQVLLQGERLVTLDRPSDSELSF